MRVDALASVKRYRAGVPFSKRRNVISLVLAFLIGAGVMAGLGVLLMDLQPHKAEVLVFSVKAMPAADQELDPSAGDPDFVHEYASFQLTTDDTIQTPVSGTVPFDCLCKNTAAPD